MSFTEADYALINLGTCIKGQADRLGIEHEGVPLEGVVVRIAAHAIEVERAAAEKAWDEGREHGYNEGRDYHGFGNGCGPDTWDCDCPNPYRKEQDDE